MKKITFILSDQTVNSYEFVVLTSGIVLDFFKKNPVMLLNHDRNKIMGKWENIRIEGTQLLADAVFDEKDPEAIKMYEKVEQGMLNCVSIGFQILEVVFGIEGYENNPVVIQCSLKEASLTPVPSNESALRLYDKDGTLLSSDQVLTLLTNNQPNTPMKKIAFFLAALPTLPAAPTEDDILLAVTNLSKKASDSETEVATLKREKSELETKLTAAEGKVTEVETAKITELVDGAIKAGKLTAEKKEQFVKLAKTDFDLAKSMIDSLPARQSLSAAIGNKGTAGATATYEGWGLKRFSKEAPTELARIKAEEPTRFQELLKANA